MAALLVYSLMIFGLSLIRIKHHINSLIFVRQLSASLVLVLFALLIVSELDFIPFLNRETLAMQNVGLIDNFTSIKDIELSINMNLFSPKVDLFYGEPSFLAVVIFASIGSFIIADSGLKTFGAKTFSETRSDRFERLSSLIPLIGIFILVYIQSLSSLIYTAVTLYFFINSRKTYKKSRLINLLFYLFVAIVAFSFSYEYFLYRITMEDSVSFIQRFGFLFEMNLIDWVIGLKDASRLPEFGIHNGVIFLITISGLGGLCYLFYLLRHAYKSAISIGLAPYAVLLILGIFSQNGGMFTPNKIVLLALILLPLVAVRSGKLSPSRSLSNYDS
tara:strand:+ start:89 stop:1084 length:996 start_codon:yes stop_codon:yes gene_type:complete